MTQDHPDMMDAETVKEEAQAWLRRLESGEATKADAAALDIWRAQSPRHAKAFADAVLLWKVLGDAAQLAPAAKQPVAVRSHRPIARRALLLGGGAMAASAAAVSVIRPPLALWPSFSELSADYRTAIGESQQIELAGQVALRMNTRTSVDLRSSSDDGERIELVAGEAGIKAQDQHSRPIMVIAGDGHVQATNASFNIRKSDANVAVTCIHGEVDVRCKAGASTIRGGQQVMYNDRQISGIAAVDADVVTAWQRGLLIFRDVPLTDVVEEVNRYRPGRIILANSNLGSRRVVANFQTDRIDDVIVFISKVMNVPSRSLPGGIVLLG